MVLRTIEEEGGDRGLEETRKVCLIVGCLTSQHLAGVSQGRICFDNYVLSH